MFNLAGSLQWVDIVASYIMLTRKLTSDPLYRLSLRFPGVQYVLSLYLRAECVSIITASHSIVLRLRPIKGSRRPLPPPRLSHRHFPFTAGQPRAIPTDLNISEHRNVQSYYIHIHLRSNVLYLLLFCRILAYALRSTTFTVDAHEHRRPQCVGHHIRGPITRDDHSQSTSARQASHIFNGL